MQDPDERFELLPGSAHLFFSIGFIRDVSMKEIRVSANSLEPIGQNTWTQRYDGTEICDFVSTAIGDSLRITVHAGTPGAPILYVLDSVILFDLAVGVANLLRTAALFTGDPFPSLTIVGVGYSTKDPGTVFASRARDLTPTDGALNTVVPLPPLAFGGAPAFLDALADEVVPLVESRYNTDPSRRALAGVSFGGLFALYALFHRPGIFTGYVIGSPSLWWDDGIASRWEETWANEQSDMAARVFLSVGGNEQTVGGHLEKRGLPA